ncbi:hypothetical protein Q5H92_22570 [Hymenobacter sp. M29]|uniref:Nuclear transport factor 2 family protein n=1 Tax=Hymenobacter mellowenesis TaxID=3063995 RepID=A0ABT9AH14_9BACT|nr:hypothetical protein [Hymenobacter sp. M29]MDO7849165.1 hypothetical protein [Hymenobacter sp. M29]
MKATLATTLLLLITTRAFAQMDTVSYAKERREIKTLLHSPGAANGPATCNDIVMVGAKGDISFSAQEHKAVQTKEKLVFKSVKPVPGTEIIRIYGGTSAVVNWLADVQLNVDGRDIALKVRRLEVYVKKAAGWCRVAGQGTEVDEKMFPIR